MEATRFIVEFQKAVQLCDSFIDIGLADFVLPGQFSDLRFDFARFIFGLPQFDVASIQSRRTVGDLGVQRGDALEPPAIPDHCNDRNRTQNRADVTMLCKHEPKYPDPDQTNK